VKVAFSGDAYEESKAAHLASLPASLKQWEKFLGDRKFVAGDYLTYVDFVLYDALDWNRLFAGESVLPANLKDYLKRIETVPQLASYFATKHQVYPIFPAMAKWGYKAE